MSTHSEAFDHWIRGAFVEINTALEELYFAQADRADVSRVGGDVKTIPGARLHVVEGGTHFPNRSHRAEVQAVIERFLGAIGV